MKLLSLKKLSRSGASLFLAGTAMIVAPLLGAFTPYAYAAGVTVSSDTMTNQATSATSDHTLVWTSSGTNAATGTIAVDFVSGDFSFNSAASFVAADFNFTDTNHTAQTPIAVGAAPSCSGTDTYIVAIDATTETFTITFCTGWVVNTVSTATTFKVFGTTAVGAGTVTNSGSNVESSIVSITYAVTQTTSGQLAIVVEPNADVVVTASVNSTLVFNVSDNTIGFGTLDASAARYANGAETGSASPVTAHTFDVATNATSGFTVTITGATLTSPAAGNPTITAIGAANTASSAGTEQFGVRFTESGGTAATVTAPYAAAGYAYDVAGMPSQVASSTGPTSTATYDAIYLANIAGSTEAGTYTTTINYVATGHF